MTLPSGGVSVSEVPSNPSQPDFIGRVQVSAGVFDLTTDYERGGTAVSDASQGLLVKDWRIRLVGDEVRLSAYPYTAETTVLTIAGITELTFTFDQLMRTTVAYVVAGRAYLWYYDSLAAAQITTTLAVDVRSPFLTMDDRRESASARNDMLLFYLRGNALYYRQQRDRFQIEYAMHTFTVYPVQITKLGLSTGLRMQIEVHVDPTTPV